MAPEAQPAKTTEKKESKVHHSSGLHHEDKKDASKPIVDNWTFDWPGEYPPPKGSISLTINSDGHWNFSGQAPQKFYDTIWSGGKGDTHFYQWDVVFAVKSSEGSVILFAHSTKLRGDLPQNSSWNKAGTNNTIKDNFAAFAKGHDWHAHYYLTAIASAAPSGGGGGGGGSDAGQDLGDIASAALPFLLAFL